MSRSDSAAIGSWRTYKFNYDTSQLLHRLTTITNEILSGEKYTFWYSPAVQLYEPFTNTAWTGTGASATRFFWGLTVEDTGGLIYNLEYHQPWTGELSKMRIPYGGYVRWDMATTTYNASRQVREVTAFVHSKDGSQGAEKRYEIRHEPNTSTLSQHSLTQVNEPDNSPSPARKEWIFGTAAGVAGMVTQHNVYTMPAGVNLHLMPNGTNRLRAETTWTNDGSMSTFPYGKPYISATVTTYDLGLSYVASKRVEQTQDWWGNLTNMKVFNWGASGGTTPRREYTNTYLGTSLYVSAYIRNRLLSSTMKENGGAPTTLVTNEYDNYGAGCSGGASCVITATTNARQKDAAYTTGYTLRGNLTSTSRYGDGSQSWNPGSWNWLFYDDTGSVVKTHDPRYVWGTAVPDASKNYAVPQSVTVAGLPSTMGWNDALGLTSTSGANGESSGTGYNTSYFVGRPASKTLPTGLTVGYQYTQNTVLETVNSTPVARWTRTTMDGFGRPVKVESGTGTPSAPGTTTNAVSVVDTEYEPCACTPIGKMKRTARPHAGSVGASAWTVHNYDALGRTVSVVAPDGASTSSYVYEGASVKTVDAKGKWKKFVKDAIGNLVTVWEPNPVLNGADLESTYSYDQFDRLTAVTKLRNSTAQTRTFTYGVQGLASKIEPETGSSTFYYRSADGRLHYQLDAKGQKIEPWYEDDLTPGFAQKRVAQIRKYPNGSTEDLCQRVEMFYHGAVPTGGDAGVSSFSAGRLSGVRYQGSGCAQTFVEQYSYTNYGAMVKKRVKMIRGAASGVLESVAEYDGEGRLKSVTYPVTNRKVQYGFNTRGLPETLTDVNAGTLIVSSVSYGVAGEVTTFVSGGGTETRGYNVNGQLTSLSMPSRTIAYNYPAAGQNNGKIESMTESGETISYQYDSLQRLTSATGSGWAQAYGYDVFGNMNAKTGSGTAPSWSGTIDAATNRLTAGVSYDANGNQTNVPLIAGSEMPDALSSMVYDVSNRLIRAENNGATRRGEYDYDPGNKRVYEKRSLNSSVVGEWAYFFGITGQRMGRYTFTVAGAAITFSQSQASVWFGGKLVQKLDGGSVSYASMDRLGSVGKYLPYGEAKSGSSNPAADNEKFATYTRDAGTGLDYADQRWHVAGSGRFLTSDPYQASGGAVDPGSWNRFGYVLGDPIYYVDPRGLEACPHLACVTVEGSAPGGGSSAYPSGLGGGGVDDGEIDPNAQGPDNGKYDPAADYKKMSAEEIAAALRRANNLLDRLKADAESILGKEDCMKTLLKLGVNPSAIGFAARNVGSVGDGFQATNVRLPSSQPGVTITVSSAFYGRAPDMAARDGAWGVWVNPDFIAQMSSGSTGNNRIPARVNTFETVRRGIY